MLTDYVYNIQKNLYHRIIKMVKFRKRGEGYFECN